MYVCMDVWMDVWMYVWESNGNQIGIISEYIWEYDDYSRTYPLDNGINMMIIICYVMFCDVMYGLCMCNVL